MSAPVESMTYGERVAAAVLRVSNANIGFVRGIVPRLDLETAERRLAELLDNPPKPEEKS